MQGMIGLVFVGAGKRPAGVGGALWISEYGVLLLLARGGFLFAQVDMVDQAADIGQVDLVELVAIGVAVPHAQGRLRKIHVIDESADIGQVALSQRVAVGVAGVTVSVATTGHAEDEAGEHEDI